MHQTRPHLLESTRREEFMALIKEGLEAKGDRTCRDHNRIINVKLRFSNKHEDYYSKVRIF